MFTLNPVSHVACQKQNILEKALSDGLSVNLRPLFNSNMTKVSETTLKQILLSHYYRKVVSDLHEGVELSCGIFLWLISAPKDTIKTLGRDVWMFLIKIYTPYQIQDKCPDVSKASNTTPNQPRSTKINNRLNHVNPSEPKRTHLGKFR